MDGLCASWICVPVVSAGSIGPMLELNGIDEAADTRPDNVLLEWAAAIELHSRGTIKAIMPIIVGDESGQPFDFALPRRLSKAEHSITNQNCIRHLERKYPSNVETESALQGLLLSVADVEPTATSASVSGIVTALLRYQGTVLDDRNDFSAFIDRLRMKCDAIMNCAHHDHEGDE